MFPRTHVQNHVYGNKGRRTYVRDVRQLSNPRVLYSFSIKNIFL